MAVILFPCYLPPPFYNYNMYLARVVERCMHQWDDHVEATIKYLGPPHPHTHPFFRLIYSIITSRALTPDQLHAVLLKACLARIDRDDLLSCYLQVRIQHNFIRLSILNDVYTSTDLYIPLDYQRMNSTLQELERPPQEAYLLATLICPYVYTDIWRLPGRYSLNPATAPRKFYFSLEKQNLAEAEIWLAVMRHGYFQPKLNLDVMACKLNEAKGPVRFVAERIEDATDDDFV